MKKSHLCFGGQPGRAVFCVQERKQFLEIGVVRVRRMQGQRLEQAFRTQLAA